MHIRKVKPFPKEEMAVVIGDILHNLRSALDILWYSVVLECNGKPTKWTRFPIFDTRKELVGKIKEALKQKRITARVAKTVLQKIRPYKAGNYPLWALERLNIRDKHQLLIPVIEFVRVNDVRFKDKEGSQFSINIVLHGKPSFELTNWNNLTVELEDKGHPSLSISLGKGLPFEFKPVIPTMSGIALEVRRAIGALQGLFP